MFPPYDHLQAEISGNPDNHILLSLLRLPQPGGQGPRIYIPQEQGGSVIPLGTGFHFHRLLRLAGLFFFYLQFESAIRTYIL
jgi:hypothetical protein